MAKAVKPSRPDINVFIREYIKDPNGKQAAIKAGYSAATAAAAASRLLKRVNVSAEIANANASKLKVVQEQTGISLSRTLKEIARIAYFDARRLFDEDGEPLSIMSLDDDTAAAIAGLESATERRRGEEDGGSTHVRKYKVADKKGALDMLMRHLGGYEIDNSQKDEAITKIVREIVRAKPV